VLLAGATVLNLIYLVCGLYDSRITTMARKRHSSDGYWIDLTRMFALVSLQVLFHVTVGLQHHAPQVRLFFHSLSILCYYLGTRMSVIGLTGGIACGKSTVV